MRLQLTGKGLCGICMKRDADEGERVFVALNPEPEFEERARAAVAELGVDMPTIKGIRVEVCSECREKV